MRQEIFAREGGLGVVGDSQSMWEAVAPFSVPLYGNIIAPFFSTVNRRVLKTV
jgi:hypothetical protein